MSRKEDNLKILEMLTTYVKMYPDIRFGQALRNIGVINDVGVKDSSQHESESPDYYIDRIILHEEPSITLTHMKKALANEYKDVKVIVGGNRK